MEDLVKRIIARLFPALDAGTVYPRWGVITHIPGDVGDGALADDDNPQFAVDVQPLRIDPASGALVADGAVIYPSVPFPVPMAGNNRGLFGFAQPGTRVLLQFVQGLPAHPVITGVYPAGRNLPALGAEETLLQHSAATFLRSSGGEDWDLRARNKLRLGNASVDLVAEVQRLASLLQGHTHPGTAPPTNAGEIRDVAGKVGSIKK